MNPWLASPPNFRWNDIDQKVRDNKKNGQNKLDVPIENKWTKIPFLKP